MYLGAQISHSVNWYPQGDDQMVYWVSPLEFDFDKKGSCLDLTPGLKC